MKINNMGNLERKIIEINGVKLEVDLRTAKRVDTFRVGDTVKILLKEYQDYKPSLGIIIGFDQFEIRPTIVVAYLKCDYYTAEIKFAYINSETKDTEICQINEWDIPYSKQDILTKIDKEIAKKQEELRDLETKRKVFIEMFGKYFEGNKEKE